MNSKVVCCFAMLVAGVFTASSGIAAPQTMTAVRESADGTSVTVEIPNVDLEAYLKARLPQLPQPNKRIVELMMEYPTSGEHTYWWPRAGESSYDGSTTDILVRGIPAMRGEAKGRTFCCGLTLEVALKVINESPQSLSNFTSDTLAHFKRLWFCVKLFSPGPSDALLAFRMGQPIKDMAKALPGDFVQLWRHNKSGHSVIFVDWARSDQGKIMGVYYWSTQPATNGIGYSLELFGDAGKSMDPKSFSLIRLLPPEKWNMPPASQILKK